MEKKLNIYFLHAKFMKERLQVIENFKKALKKYRFKNIKLGKFHIIHDFDPDSIDGEVIRKYVNYERITESHVESYNGLLRNLHINQLSNTLKHYKALELIAQKSSDSELNLVLEDDVLFEDKVCNSLDKLVVQMPHKHDIIYLGLPTINEQIDKSKYTFQDTHKIFKILPMCDSYLVSHSTAKALHTNYIPIKFSNNIQVSYICDKLGIETLQSISNIFIDGSKYGLFLSKVSSNNPLIFNNDFTTLRGFLTQENITEEEHVMIKKMLETSPIRNNPDFIHMECGYYIKEKNYKKAKERFDIAYKTYVSNGCILSNESIFLKDYIRIHKYIQDDVDEVIQ
jgi:GR25 family glycosyltransferase involved in LPS biosynthesis